MRTPSFTWLSGFTSSLAIVGMAVSCTFPDPIFKDSPAFANGGGSGGEPKQQPTSDAGADSARPTDGGATGRGGAGGAAGQFVIPGGEEAGVPDADIPDAPNKKCPGEDCSPVAVAQGERAVFSIAADEEAVFWISQRNTTDWTRLSFARHGGSAQELWGTLTDKSHSLSLDRMSVFFGKDLASIGGVFRTARNSTSDPDEVIFQDYTKRVLTDSLAIYYEAANGVARVAKGSNARKQLAPPHSRLLAVDSDNVLLLDTAVPSFKLKAVKKDASRLFEHAEILLDNAPDIESLVFDNEAYYFAVEDEGKIYRLARGAVANLPVVLAADEARPVTLRSDEKFLYWITDATHELRAMPKSGGTPIRLGFAQPGALAVADGRVFWATPREGALPEFGRGDILMIETF